MGAGTLKFLIHLNLHQHTHTHNLHDFFMWCDRSLTLCLLRSYIMGCGASTPPAVEDHQPVSKPSQQQQQQPQQVPATSTLKQPQGMNIFAYCFVAMINDKKRISLREQERGLTQTHSCLGSDNSTSRQSQGALRMADFEGQSIEPPTAQVWLDLVIIVLEQHILHLNWSASTIRRITNTHMLAAANAICSERQRPGHRQPERDHSRRVWICLQTKIKGSCGMAWHCI